MSIKGPVTISTCNVIHTFIKVEHNENYGHLTILFLVE